MESNMPKDPTDPASNVLYNKAAMAIIEEACKRLSAMGLVCGFAPDKIFDESDMTVVLRVSTSLAALEETVASGLLADQYMVREDGRNEFTQVLLQYRADCAIHKAMNGPVSDSI